MRAYRVWLFCAISLILLIGNSACLPGDIFPASRAAPLPSGGNSEPAPTAEIGIFSSAIATYLPYMRKEMLASGYPRLANVYGTNDPQSGMQIFGRYDLYIPYKLRDPDTQVAAIRAANSKTKILLTLEATHGALGLDPLATEWAASKPGEPGYQCLLRDSRGTILRVEYWGHPMYNMTVPYCREVILQGNLTAFLSQVSADGAPLYDGIFWDLLFGEISWLSDDIDSNLDGRPDDVGTLNEAYKAGVQDFLTKVRASLPEVILIGNEAPLIYDKWINGRMFEWQLPSILNGNDSLTWDDVVDDYLGWTKRGRSPRLTFIASRPESIYGQKFPFGRQAPMPLAMQKEAAASYQRMRYGLTTALMGDGLFWFDTRLEDQGVWWYDEFGAPAGDSASLPPPGYLGWPTGEPRLAAEQLDTPDQVINGGFEKGLTNWRWWVDSTTGAGASITVEPTGGISGTTGAHIAVARPAKRWSVLLWQPGISTVAGQSYTLSFWARSDTPRTVYARVRQEDPPETDYGFRGQVTVTPQWQWFHLWDTATVTAADGEIALQLGEDSGDLWLDAIQFQEGALGVWARPFQNGLAIVNPTMAVQKVPLDRAYCKLNGNQAPLFQARVDDDAASTSTGWVELPANTEQFGKTVKVANGGTGVSATYVPSLAYEGRYEILAWVVPKSTQSDAVSVTIHHAHGESVTMLDQTSGESGWHSLGMYDFNAGEIGSATLKATGTGTVVADAFKWVHTARYNDGSQVTQVTLQPQDGIVLLTRCYAPDPASQPTDVNKRQHSGAQ